MYVGSSPINFFNSSLNFWVKGDIISFLLVFLLISTNVDVG